MDIQTLCRCAVGIEHDCISRENDCRNENVPNEQISDVRNHPPHTQLHYFSFIHGTHVLPLSVLKVQ